MADDNENLSNVYGAEDADATPQPIHLGLRLGVKHLTDYLHIAHRTGVNHVALNLRFNQMDIEKTMEHLARDVLPEFHQ